MRVYFSIVSCLVAAGVYPAFAQVTCEPGTNVSLPITAEKVENLCCSKKKSKTRRVCLNKEYEYVRRTKDSLGEEWVEQALLLIKGIKDSACDEVPVPECSESTLVTHEQVETNANTSCCELNTKSARRRCFNKLIARLHKARKSLGPAFVKQAKANIKVLRAADCGIEEDDEPETKCDKTRKNRDGADGGWLHKPVSDSTHSIVNLFPVKDEPSSCRYEKKNGMLIRKGYSSGRHNGYREHIRPEGGGFCSSFPRNMVLRCKIGRKWICYNIPNPCERYD